MFRRWGLTKQFATVFLILITLPTILFGSLIYIQTTKIFKDQAEDSTIELLEKNEESLRAVIRGIESMSSYMIYDENFRTFFLTKEEEMASEKYKKAEEGIRGYFTFQITSQDYIDSILLRARDGHELRFGNPVAGNEEALDRAAEDLKGKFYWSDAYPMTSDWDGQKAIVSLSRVINDINHINEPVGMVRIRLDEEDLYHAYGAGLATKQGDYFLMSENGEVVLSEDSSQVGQPFPSSKIVNLVVHNKQATTDYRTNHTTYLVVKKKIEGTRWFSVAIVDKGEVVHELYNVRSLIVTMIILLAILGIIAFIGFYIFNIKRIVELTNQTKQLETGDFSVNVQVKTEDEIGQLGMRFNQMVKKIQQHINTEYKLKIKQKESELKSLQNQMDPHFLYNTLDMIRWTARLEKAMETGQLIERLSKIFRLNLNKGKMWVRLEDELNYIYNYLELQKSRLGEKLDFHIFYDAELKDAILLSHVLQPLVENSIAHGFKGLGRQGTITVRCYRKNNMIWMDVIDNGCGFKPSNSKEEGGGLALRNLQERIAIAFGGDYGIEQLEDHEGAWIRVKIPFLLESDIKIIDKEQGENDES
ncbi:histidine kinase [Halobacillus salinarum]|uniref:Histidine kinase n=1 Tax=Halobacillus salinarum TaxID=2932257 RepID=A0ABY4ENS3_9BACI|nr:histidine kinase [Halobacillus salinarum]UOQ45635.1 histidine kinase [Halobacillus salinarum]